MSGLAGASGSGWDRIEELLEAYGGETNVARLICDRHPSDSVALRTVRPDLSVDLLTFGELRERSDRFANALVSLGVGRGDRVATLMGKSQDLLVTVVGLWRLGAVHVPLFTAFAGPAVAVRVTGSAAKVVVCDEGQRPKLDELPTMPVPPAIVVAGKPASDRDMSFEDLIASKAPTFDPVPVGSGGAMVHLYTSGTTGTPKAVVVPAGALAAIHAYMELGLDVRPDDVFWNAADPGWAYGHYYGIVGPLLTGTPNTWVQGGFSASLTWKVLHSLEVTNFAAAPTVYRSLMAAPAGSPRRPSLRCASSAGEPLTPEVNAWSREALGVEVHDQYGQTETGMLINNHHHPALARALKEGCMGQAMPGWTIAVLSADADEPVPPGVVGRIAVDRHASPLAWFDGYLGEPEKSREKFSADGRWYLTGDLGSVDEDGDFRFLSRDDDVIIMAGYRIGPSDVEAVLLGHPSVAEAAVVSAPDTIRGEVLEAFVVLRQGCPGDAGLVEQLQQKVKREFAAHAYPRAVHFVDRLPKTPSGKIQRYVLRQQRREELADLTSALRGGAGTDG